MKSYRVEMRYSPPGDNALHVVEFEEKDDAFAYANKVVRLAERLKASGSKDVMLGGEIEVWEISRSTDHGHRVIFPVPKEVWREDDGHEA